MANSLHIKNRAEAVKRRMKGILRNIAREYESGEIKTTAELQHRVYVALESFYASIGKSVFKPIKAWGPPYSSDHNQMMKQIHEDISSLYDEVSQMTEDLKGSFEQVEIERQAFHHRILNLEDKIKGIDINLSASFSRIVFRDHFADHEQYEKDMAKETPAHLSSDERLLTLARIESENHNEYASITITKGNGLPGNTHIVRSVGDGLKFDGEEELHINLADVLDGNADTWFEYEMIEIPDRTEALTEGKGFEYKEGIEWGIRSERDLELTIHIELAHARAMNWISLSPFIPSDKGASAAEIVSLMVSDGKGDVKTLTRNTSFESEKGFLFPKQDCKTIIIQFKQSVSYEADIGHTYFKQINKETESVMEADDQEGVRVHGPAPSVTNLGVVYDTGKQEIVYPIQKHGDTIEGEAERKEALFHPPPTDPSIQAGIEKVSAWRYMIGFRDAILANYQFETISEYVSKPFYSPSPITEVELEVDAEIPPVFPKEEEWLEYFISIDQGKNWHPICPRNMYHTVAKTKYMINSNTPKEGRLEEMGYLESLVDVHEIQFRILIKRPTDIESAASYTPIVYGYELYVGTNEEVGS